MKIEIPKINLEILILIFSLIIMIFNIFYTESSYTDTYWQYIASKEILKYPSALWSPLYKFGLTGGENALIGYPFSTFPLLFIIYAILIGLNLTPEILNVVATIGILFIMYKTYKKAVPLLFLSFLFIRTFAFGGNDGVVALFGLLCIYFFEKKPWASAVFAGLSVMVKGTGYIVFIPYILSLLILNRKYFVKGLIISLLIFSPWILRNYMITKGSIESIIIGSPAHYVVTNQTPIETFLLLKNQTEANWWDTSGYFPLPFDILFFTGVIFLFIDMYRRRMMDIYHIFVIIGLIIYILGQTIPQLGWIMILRYYLPVIPIFALIIARNLPEKSLKIVYAICLISLLVWSYYLNVYSFGFVSQQINPNLCTAIKSYVDDKSVWIIWPHQWYVLYKCGLTPGYRNESDYTVDLINGDILDQQNISVIPPELRKVNK